MSYRQNVTGSALGEAAGLAVDGETACDREPITRLGRIQPFGFLLAMARDWTVTHASANLAEHLGFEPAQVLGAALEGLLAVEALHEIRNRMIVLRAAGGVERLYDVVLVAGRAAVDIAVHYVGETFILEGEPAGADNRTDAASMVRTMTARLSKQTTLTVFHREAARQLRAMTGFDRVMIYRFDADGHGEVVAEAVSAGTESFLGLHYPASDIPAQARRLYLNNPFRIIADVGAATVPVLAVDGAGEPLDLASAITRAVSPIHVEYLRNMKVGASMSISIIVDGVLWGLIACHHLTARLPTFVIRTATELFGQMYSMKLENRLRSRELSADRHLQAAIDVMLAAIDKDPALLGHAGWLHDALREMIQCDGVVLYLGGKVTASGQVPGAADVAVLARLLRDRAGGELFSTDHLGALLPAAFAYPERAAGLLAISLSSDALDYFMLFRRERRHEIRWGGQPDPVAASADPAVPTAPRKSFAAVSELVRDHSSPFTDAERHVARAIRAAFAAVVKRGPANADPERQRSTERQEVLIAELNHRVRNVLALIRGLISQTQGQNVDVASYVESLNGRVQALARAHDRVTRQNWGPGPLEAIFEDEIAAYVPTQRERFTISGPSVQLQPQAFSTVSLIVHELVTNSCKHGALSDSGRVAVAFELHVDEGLYLHWREVDGPQVKTPTRRGFGSVILERMVPFDLQGWAALHYRPTGLEADFFIPLRHIAAVVTAGVAADPAATGPATGSFPADPADPRPLAGRTVLLLEDNLIVSLEAEDLLRGLGARVVWTASTIATASAILERQRPDFAMLDISLGAETSLEFSLAVEAANVPFIFASGYGEAVAPGALRDPALTVTKPYDRDTLRQVVARALAASPYAVPASAAALLE